MLEDVIKSDVTLQSTPTPDTLSSLTINLFSSNVVKDTLAYKFISCIYEEKR